MNYVPPTHQAAGHAGYFTPEDNSLFIKATNQQEIDFYTQVQHHDCVEDEQQLDEDSNPGSKLIDWIPTYMGTLSKGTINPNQANDITSIIAHPHPPPSTSSTNPEYIVLQNLYQGFKHPSILDIKLGSLLTDPHTTAPEKIERLQKVSDSTTSGSFSFRICGMKVYCNHCNNENDNDNNNDNNNDNDNGNDIDNIEELYPNMRQTSIDHSSIDKDTYVTFNKVYGRSLDASNIKEGLLLYFRLYFEQHSDGNKIILKLLTNFLNRLQLLYNCLLDYTIRIYSGSLLFIYESDLTKWNEDVVNDDESYQVADPLVFEPTIEEEDGEDEDGDDDDDDDGDVGKDQFVPLSSLHLIDFAHAKFVDKSEGYDENIINGIENLISLFESIIDSYKA